MPASMSQKPPDTVGEFTALPPTACGRSIKGSLNDPMKGDPGKFGREQGQNMEFANSIRSFMHHSAAEAMADVYYA
jgi:hypothetical protein